MKKYIYILVAILCLIGGCIYFYNQSVKYREMYDIATANIKAYELDLKGSQDQVRMYQRTISELRESGDSLTQELLKVKKEKGIKDKEVQSMYYQLSQAAKTDTILFPVPVIRDSVKIDTLLSDKWYSLNLKLEAPSTIVAKPQFNSERYVIISSKKETINKPSKLFFVRWFQKKHTVVTVDVEEKNPYIDINQQRFIEIIK